MKTTLCFKWLVALVSPCLPVPRPRPLCDAGAPENGCSSQRTRLCEPAFAAIGCETTTVSQPGAKIMRALTRLFATLVCVFTPAAFAATTVYFSGQQGEPLSNGQTINYTVPADGFSSLGEQTVYSPQRSQVVVNANNIFLLVIGAPGLSPLQVGDYELAVASQSDESKPYLYFSNSSGVYCPTRAGRFTVREITRGSSGEVLSLAVDFQQRCNGRVPTLFGQVRVNSAVPIDTSVRWPNVFEFPPVADAILGSTVVSATALIQTTAVSLPVSVSSGEYSINGGAFVSTPSSILPGQNIKVRLNASTSPNTVVTATLKIGEFEARFAVGTSPGKSPQPVGEPLAVVTGGRVLANGEYDFRVFGPATFYAGQLTKSYQGFQMDFVGPIDLQTSNTKVWSAVFSARNAPRFSVGAYIASNDSATSNAGVAFGGNGAGAPVCSSYSAITNFTVREIEYDLNDVPAKLALDFFQSCGDADGTAVFGYIRFNSVLPVDYSVRLPGPFAFPVVKGAALGSVVESNEVLVTGINVPVPISIVRGEYSVDGGAFRSTAGTVVKGQRVRIRTTAANQHNTAKEVILTLGERSASFVVATVIDALPQPNAADLVVLLTSQTQSPSLIQTVFSAASLYKFSFQATSGNGAALLLTASTMDNNGTNWNLNAASANGLPLAVGDYQNVRSTPYGATSSRPYLYAFSPYSSVSPYCAAEDGGRFRVHEIEYSTTGQPLRLAMDFIQKCTSSRNTGNPPYVFGFVRINSSVPIDYSVRLASPLYFGEMTGAAPGALVESDDRVINGINVPVAISVVNGEYSIGGGPYTASPGTVSVGQTVRVRLRTAATANSLATLKLLVGESENTFTVATAPGANPPTNNAPLILLRNGTYSSAVPIVMSPATLSVISVTNSASNYVEVLSRDQFGSNEANLGFAVPYGGRLTVGRYLNAAESPISGSGQPQFRFGVRYGACSGVREFTVREVAYAGNEVTVLAIDFECASGYNASRVSGYIRFNSNIPIPRAATRITNDFTGDNKSDLIFTDSSGAVNVMLLNGLTPTVQANLLGANSGWTVTHIADLDGDGNADVIIRNTDGRAAALLVRAVENPVATGIGTTTSGTRVVYVPLLDAGSGWSVSRAADFDADGSADLLIVNPDGRVAILMMNGGAVSTYTLLTNVGSGYSVAMTGDFNGDGRADIVLKNTNGSAAVVLMDGPTVTSASLLLTPGSPWTPTFAGDLNGDGKSDIVIKSADGTVVLLLMNGTAVSSAAYLLTAGTPYSVTHVGDFNGDLKSDFILRHTDGSYALILMDGTTVTGFNTILAKGSGATVSQIGDYNGDGKSDILVRTSDGSALMLLMNGTATSSAGIVWGAGTRVVVP
jgi:FG-GAP-like repeat